MTNFVQLYKSTDANAPSFSGSAGSLVALLDAILINGYTTASISGITRSGGVATATLASANATLVTGNWITIAGAVETQYNGTVQITVVDSTHFTFVVSGSPSTPATGTITYRKAPLGWQKVFSGTNKAAYRSQDVASNQFYLRVDDSGGGTGTTKEALVRGFEAMTDVDTGTNAFPTTIQVSAGLAWRKSATADGTARAWTLVGDDRTFYFVPVTGDAASFRILGFGHYLSYKPSDGYCTFVGGDPTQNNASPTGCMLQTLVVTGLTATTNVFLYGARDYSQVGGSVLLPLLGTGSAAQIPSQTTMLAYPNGPDAGFYAHPFIVCAVSGTAARGRLPGVYGSYHAVPLGHYNTATNVAGLSGATLTAATVQTGTATGEEYFDTFGPWT